MDANLVGRYNMIHTSFVVVACCMLLSRYVLSKCAGTVGMFSELQQTTGAGMLAWGPAPCRAPPGVGNQRYLNFDNSARANKKPAGSIWR